jgi:hypothetical protein
MPQKKNAKGPKPDVIVDVRKMVAENKVPRPLFDQELNFLT